MEKNVIESLSVAASVFVLLIGLTAFFSIYAGFFRLPKDEDEISLRAGEKVEKSYASKSDIYYTYDDYADDADISDMDVSRNVRPAIFVDGLILDYADDRDKTMGFLASLSSVSFDKDYVYDGDEIKEIHFVSR